MRSLHNFTTIKSEERGVLEDGSIPVAILPLCQDMKTIAYFLLIDSWVLKIRSTSEAYALVSLIA